MSSEMYLVCDFERGPSSDSVSNGMLTVRISSQITVFFTIIKPTQYIYQIEDREILVNNLRSLPHESLPVGQKVTRKPQINSGSSWEKVAIHWK